ncbi:aminoglycoside phosphotransferase family protein [Candidatus Poribacteria bacterium]|nr:aminoglycoside phosphotransferase family protein [Candidatus Poribacteria bacterium]MBT5533521.1 aminoglycoside phosphotransferase family protein [Candidatus Poribacteria bacterium]MBT5714221.1 aminoglycoside phosphotransferase family protein [Candidatus Poribacteria bacterium]MBT7097001.1 aminoglycoside phosphotransferase family protein [Candidatus Poribacteria bacterium]MBT7807224.1 aminoglycoside phosphotransferase family protein [Candidatus Poribacteria bacterium]
MVGPELLARIEALIGSRVESHARAEGGYTPATRLVCQTATGSFFVKAGATPLTCGFLRREAHVYGLIDGPFVPQVVAWEDHETAPILVTEDLSHAHWPPPWDTTRVDRALAQAEAMHSTTVELGAFAEVHGRATRGWRTVAEDPEPFLSLGFVDDDWLDIALPTLVDHEQNCPTDGDRLTHFDLRSDNMCMTDDRVLFIDWNCACLGNPRLDLGFWLPSLAYEGGPTPDTILPDAPEVAAVVMGYFAANAGLDKIPDAPRVRVVQRQQLVTGLPWLVRALELPPLVDPAPRF